MWSRGSHCCFPSIFILYIERECGSQVGVSQPTGLRTTALFMGTTKVCISWCGVGEAPICCALMWHSHRHTMLLNFSTLNNKALNDKALRASGFRGVVHQCEHKVHTSSSQRSLQSCKDWGLCTGWGEDWGLGTGVIFAPAHHYRRPLQSHKMQDCRVLRVMHRCNIHGCASETSPD